MVEPTVVTADAGGVPAIPVVLATPDGVMAGLIEGGRFVELGVVRPVAADDWEAPRFNGPFALSHPGGVTAVVAGPGERGVAVRYDRAAGAARVPVAARPAWPPT